MNNTKIEWTDMTWNPVTGCKHGCDYCYARKLAETRLNHIYPNGFKPTFWEDRIEQPLSKTKPCKIFVSSMGDLFGEWVPDEWIKEVIKTIENCPEHTFQFLTKNPYRYKEFDFPENCWLGTTIEGDDPENTYHRYWGLYEKSDNIQFISLEPLLGMEDIKSMFVSAGWLDWVIIGAQTGPGAEEPKEEWVEGIIQQCREVGIPVFLKDNLNWPEKIQEWPKEEKQC